MRTPLLFLLSLLSTTAQAYTDFNPGDLSALSEGNVNDLLRTAAIGTGHRAMQPASSLGLALGLDIGIDTVAISIPDNFKTAIALATQTPAGQVPSTVPIPRLNIHKGFPMKIDLGFSWASYQGIFSVWGVDGQWNFLGSGSKAALAGRVSYGKSTLYFLESHNLSIDGVASTSLVLIEPYVGLGTQIWGGDLNISGATVGLPGNVAASQSGATGHIFVGTPLKLVFLRLTFELDYSFSGLTTYGGKVSLSF